LRRAGISETVTYLLCDCSGDTTSKSQGIALNLGTSVTKDVTKTQETFGPADPCLCDGARTPSGSKRGKAGGGGDTYCSANVKVRALRHVPQRTLQYWLKSLVEDGRLTQEGKGPAAQYLLYENESRAGFEFAAM
jgi:hypothetical protein